MMAQENLMNTASEIFHGYMNWDMPDINFPTSLPFRDINFFTYFHLQISDDPDFFNKYENSQSLSIVSWICGSSNYFLHQNLCLKLHIHTWSSVYPKLNSLKHFSLLTRNANSSLKNKCDKFKNKHSGGMSWNTVSG
jgi:predicted PolB exonuclease-like 3'-5' exonuclease